MAIEEYAGDSAKKKRTIMTPSQSRTLIHYFEMNPFPSTELREELAGHLNIRARTVQIWFQNQRQKLRSRCETKSDARAGHDAERKAHGYRKLCLLASAAAKVHEELRERRGKEPRD
jgi:hypothetical protein